MKKFIVGLIVATIMTGTTYAVMDNSQVENHQKTHQKDFERLKTELNLTDQQINQIKEIKKDEHQEMKNFMKKEFKNPFIEATKNGNFDKDVFKNTVVENAKKKSEIKAKYIEKMFSVLNEEQKKKFIQIMKEKFEKMHEKMEH